MPISFAIPSTLSKGRERRAGRDGSVAHDERAGPLPRHVAIVMDGNGRWATRRGLPRALGHRAGARAVRRVVEAARRRGIGVLTLFAFSADNWRRPADEVDALMELFERYLAREARQCRENGIRLRVIGRRDRLSPSLVAAVGAAEARTAPGEAMELRIAVDYSGRDAILAAAGRLAQAPETTRPAFLEALGRAGYGGTPEVDLLVRTGGEHRVSDFLLWEIAYAELFFTDRLWPDAGAGDLDEALEWFAGRERRFGALPRVVPASVSIAGGFRETAARAS